MAKSNGGSCVSGPPPLLGGTLQMIMRADASHSRLPFDFQSPSPFPKLISWFVIRSRQAAALSGAAAAAADVSHASPLHPRYFQDIFLGWLFWRGATLGRETRVAPPPAGPPLVDPQGPEERQEDFPGRQSDAPQTSYQLAVGFARRSGLAPQVPSPIVTPFRHQPQCHHRRIRKRTRQIGAAG